MYPHPLALTSSPVLDFQPLRILWTLVLFFALKWCRIDRTPQSQSVRVEPRDDAEVERRRQKLLQACNGFRDYDDHLKTFFNTEPNTKTQSE